MRVNNTSTVNTTTTRQLFWPQAKLGTGFEPGHSMSRYVRSLVLFHNFHNSGREVDLHLIPFYMVRQDKTLYKTCERCRHSCKLNR